MKTFLCILLGMILTPIIATLLIFGLLSIIPICSIGKASSTETLVNMYWLILIIGGGIIGWAIRRGL